MAPATSDGGFYRPDKPEMSASPPRIIIIGAGSRGFAYARAIQTCCNGIVVAVAEPDDYKRARFERSHIRPSITATTNGETPSKAAEGSTFVDWHDFIAYEKARRQRAAANEADVPPGVDAAFVCVQDNMHRDVVVALSDLGGIHVMCEKPLATSLAHCVEMYRALRKNHVPGPDGKKQQAVFSIGHVLRYSPHNILLRKLLLEDRVIGDLLSIVHTEPVGWWHFTHSYVRGNWRREDTSAPTLLTKSCHDIDILLWLLCSPPSYTGKDGTDAVPHLPSTVTSSGGLQYFKKSRKPVAAGNATNCLKCPIESECKYSAKRIYVSDKDRGLGAGNKSWPVSIVLPDIESYGTPEKAEAALLEKLAEDYDENTPDSEVKKRNWFGRCVYEADNDVADEEVVTMRWEEDFSPSSATSESSAVSKAADPAGGRGAKTAAFHMVFSTKRVCHRFSNIFGVDGQVYADSDTITVDDFRTGKTTVHTPPMESESGHGGGDNGLARQFVLAVDRVKNHGWESDRAQKELVGCTLEEVIRSHAMVFCAEEARKGKKIVDWKEWWDREVEGKLD